MVWQYGGVTPTIHTTYEQTLRSGRNPEQPCGVVKHGGFGSGRLCQHQHMTTADRTTVGHRSCRVSTRCQFFVCRTFSRGMDLAVSDFTHDLRFLRPGYRRISRCLSTRLPTRDRQTLWPSCPAQFWGSPPLGNCTQWAVNPLPSRSPKSLQSLTGLRSSLRLPLCLTKAGSCGGHRRADAHRPEL